jgi:multicomponent Na+:H+ antiporter subunit C
MILALTIAVLVTGSVYLIQQRGMVRVVFGMSLLGHAANLTLLAGGVGAWRGEPFPDRTPLADAADPLPQAFVLTAIVIAMATTTILLTLAALGHDDDTNVPEPADDTIAPDPMTTLGRAASRSTGGN